ncbi:MAG: hypothetical protein AVDCRST_MAG58-4251 [uncultured Rubrobacteraceae bacterium]|uniref:Uncharacterized protein n=1 Tax=uncultured Rubrobacteraceae bacterium TaxID=349277 RepID=A0A6J4RK48_9ACTN|nr:MAG: hypothetical protein AVDCRST_MAG58-4251 [uncultured Rubrobacteraceae bacterium]
MLTKPARTACRAAWVRLVTPRMAVVVIPIALGHVQESRDPEAHRLDLAGVILATSGLAGLVYALIESSALGLGSPRVLSTLILGVISLSAFVFV